MVSSYQKEVVQGQGYAIISPPFLKHISPVPDPKEKNVKDKAQHAVVLEKQVAERLNKDVQSYRLITVATLVDRLKINGSLARQCLADLEEKGQIKKVVSHSKMTVYTRAVTAE
ncbi:ribosomal protein S25 [Aspergillus violaceofuscus CBS 115571]|uniref:40S ribosomal protein S25 n=1 Tax=Aspergillus violaceofuscus (strain CBS 115571) TaxID=1450538 RepID=A0A2V5HHA6_ASPV1|nr:ribosomal protein S25 [Aspergillus violaceofuscus CBS 115571]